MSYRIINEASPSRINMKDNYPIFYPRLASKFEIIKYRNITDINKNYIFFQIIYHQENDVPIYNPKGLYIVKLYHFCK